MAIISLAVVVGALAVALILFFLVRREIRTAKRDTLQELRDMMRKAHDGYSDPSAAAVVTDGRESSPLPAPLPDPAPAMARAALPAVAQGPTPELDETTRSRLQRISREDRSAAREAWAGVQAERTERTAIEMPRLDVGDRETPEEEPPPASGGRGFVEERLSLDEEDLAHIDELAAQRGMTREEMISVLLESGFSVRERPRK